MGLAGKNFKVSQSPLTFQVSFGAEFPVEVQAANNNVGIEYFNDRIYIGFRSVKGLKAPLFFSDLIIHYSGLGLKNPDLAPTHFATNETEMILASAIFDPSNGDIENLKWEHEKTITMDSDMREPYFLALDGSLIFYFFKAGTNPIAFEPDFIYSTRFSRLYGCTNWFKKYQKTFLSNFE